MPGSSHDVVEYSAERLIAALDDAPPRSARALDEGREDPEQIGYRALACAVLRQLTVDMETAYRLDPSRALSYLARLSAQENGPFSVWCQVLAWDVEDVIDQLIEHITAQRVLHGEAAAD